jgi:CubicO group peptidase (beta-lactamase class C family)
MNDTLSKPHVISKGIIAGNQITIFLPPGTPSSNLVANFSLSDSTATVTVDGVTQHSGATANDFSKSVTYTVTAADGASQSYVVWLITDINIIDEAVAAFMTKYSVPALSIAITEDDRLVYAKSYGYSDLDNKVAASNKDRYRLGSLSKQITSAVIMRLIDQGKVHMTDKVFGPGSILGTDFGTYPYSPGVSDITVDELLHHTSGGWGNDEPYGDPAFMRPGMSQSELLSYVLDNYALDTIPGTHYDYSNFGYFVLGRVIEKVTGLKYAVAADSLILHPSGVPDMRIAGNRLSDRAPGEVIYYGQEGEDPYNLNINRLDAVGGWMASASDMARFLSYTDGISQDNLLSPRAMQLMLTGSSANPSYGCGWVLTNKNHWHNGSLPGTYTEDAVTHQAGNFNFVILTNTRDPNREDDYLHDMDHIFWNAVNNMTAWPSYDLFSRVKQH